MLIKKLDVNEEFFNLSAKLFVSLCLAGFYKYGIRAKMEHLERLKPMGEVATEQTTVELLD